MPGPHSKLKAIGKALRAEERRFIGYMEIERKSKALGFGMTVRTIRFYVDEGILPAPEPTHAVAATIREAVRCRESGEEKTILMALCGHGHFDLRSYKAYLAGELSDYEYPTEKVAAAMERVPVISEA